MSIFFGGTRSTTFFLMDHNYKGDRELLHEIILHDDHRAFKVFFNRYYHRLVRFCFYYVKTHENAEDVVEEVFYRFLRKRKHLDIQNISSFLFMMARNAALNFVKKNRHRLLHANLEFEEDYHYQTDLPPDSKMVSDEFEKVIYAVIDSFPPKRKVIFQLSREEQMSYREIATLLDVSVKTVESHISVAMKTLRRAVADYDEGLDTTMRRFDVS
jgi:RNA polymerase sigma-70 factor (ECF subfamily)